MGGWGDPLRACALFLFIFLFLYEISLKQQQQPTKQFATSQKRQQ